MSGFEWVSHRVLAAPPSVCHKREPVLFSESPSEEQSVPVILCRLWCKVVLIREAVKIKVCLLLPGGEERSVYKLLLNENTHTGVPFSSLLTVFDYQVPFRVWGASCSMESGMSPQQHALGTLQA